MRRLPWLSSEENIQLHVIKAVLKMARTKYVSLPNIADCLSGLSKYYPNLVIEVSILFQSYMGYVFLVLIVLL